MKDHRLLALLFVMLFPALNALALENWHLPMAPEIKTVMIYNSKNQAESLWISRPIRDIEENFEEQYEVPAFGHLEIPLLEYRSSAFIHFKSADNSRLRIQVLTSNNKSFSLPKGWTNRWKVRGRPNGELVLSNLSPFDQSVEITTTSSQAKVALKAFETIRWKMKSSSMYLIEGQNRVAGISLSSSVSQGLDADDEQSTLTPGPGRFFLVQGSRLEQNFVINVSDPKVLANIDQQIQRPDFFMGRILIGQVSFGNDQHNRQFAGPSSAPWSWHISKVLGFSELASQACDGSPEFLEEILSPWVQSGMPICFWDYRVTRELSSLEVASGLLNP
jgi:hypothetical protein